MSPDAIDLFAGTERGLAEPRPITAALRERGPVVRVDAPAGGSVWVVTDEALARAALADPRIVKDPAFAPPGWDPQVAGLEPPAAAQVSLTTLDGPPHAALRRAHAPLFGARRMNEHGPRITAIARELLGALPTGSVVDLTEDFTARYPLTVVCDVLGVPLELVDEAILACRRMFGDDPAEIGKAMAGFGMLGAAALRNEAGGIAVELRDRMPDGITEADVVYLLFGLIFAGQLTTDAALGFLLARLLDGQLDPPGDPDSVEGFVRETLRRHPPAPFTLWRFTAAEVRLADEVLPPRSPLLVDVLGVNTASGSTPGQDLTFGAGPHFCIGAQLAQLELRILVQVLREDFPLARLAVPFDELRQTDSGGIQSSRVVALPVLLGE